MDSIRIDGFVDEQHRLSAEVPGSVPPGPVTVWISTTPDEEDQAGLSWMDGIVHEWADELADSRQDVYTLADGDPIDPS